MADYISINGKKSKYSIKLSGKADKVIEEIKKHTNEKGYFNFELCERKEPGKYGETHYVKVDEWKPEQKHSNSEAKQEQNFRVPDSGSQDLPF